MQSLFRARSVAERDFERVFVDAGRWYKAEIAVIMFVAVGGLYLVEPFLFDDPVPFVNQWGSVAVGFGLANMLRLASCLRRAVPAWSTWLFIVSILIDVAWLMTIRALADRGGYDILPIIVPVAFLASLLIVNIPYSILVPSMVLGLAMIAGIELATIPVSGAGAFDLVTSGAIILVPLVSARFHEQQSRLSWAHEGALDRLSTTDPLTGLPNRRAFDEHAAAVLSDELPVALAIFDVDRFKDLNDTLGHLRGDDVLRIIGDRLRSAVDGTHCVIARLSGEEFVAVWSRIDHELALADAHRLRRVVGDLRLPSGRSATTVTMSAGFVWAADVAEAEHPVDAMLAAADLALYTAKRDGRDRLAEAPRLDPATVPLSTPRAPTFTVPDPTPTALIASIGEHDRDFLVAYEGSGHRARRVIDVGILIITLAIIAVAGSVPAIPAETATVGRWFLALGIVPLALVTLVDSMVQRLQPWSTPIRVMCLSVFVIVEAVARSLPVPEMEHFITVLMPISVILSLGVVQIRVRLIVPVMVGLFAVVVATDLVVSDLDAETILRTLAATSMVAVVIQATFRLQQIAYRNRLRVRALDAAARVDVLTGLPNRRQLSEDLGARLATDRAATVAVMVDVDHLKEYNDRFGHLAGDACLRRIGDALTSVSPSMTVYRFGGEEFAALIDHRSVDDAVAIARELVTAVESVGLPSATDGRPVTVSAGLSPARPGDTPTTLIDRADAALYTAKTTGRNRLVVAPVHGTVPSPVTAHDHL